MKKRFLLLLFVATLLALQASAAVILDDDFSSLTGWNQDPLNYFNHGTYEGMYYKMLDDYSTQGYIYQYVGLAGPVGSVYSLEALITYRLYANYIPEDTNLVISVKLAISDDDPVFEMLNDASDVVLSLDYSVGLNVSSTLTSGSTDGDGYWAPESAYAGSYAVDAEHAGKPMYILIDSSVDVAPNDSGLQIGISRVTLLPAGGGLIGTYHVNNQHPAASDSNSGTIDLPLATIGKGIDLALMEKAIGSNSTVLIHPGTYTEEIFRDLNGADTQALLTIEADQPGTVTLTGADVWDTGWTQVPATSKYTHNWPYDWGPGPNHQQGGPVQEEIMLRKELILVDEKIYTQVLDIADLQEEMFHVDEATDTLTVYLPAGTNISDVTVEVAVRGGTYPDNLFRMDQINNLTIRGLKIEKSRGNFYNDALCVVSCPNVLIEDCDVSKNNFHGLCIWTTNTATVRRVNANNNGYSNRIGYCNNLLVEDCQFNENNWRGDLAEYYAWDTAGTKMMFSSNVTFRRCKWLNNSSAGLWFDTDIANIIIEQCEFSGNYLSGLSLENVQGPIDIDDGDFICNLRSGIEIDKTSNGTLTNSFFKSNKGQPQLNSETYNWYGSQIKVSGPPVYTFEGNVYKAKNWTWANNILISSDPYIPLMDIDNRWWSGDTEFVDTLISYGNTGYHPEIDKAFKIYPSPITLETWQAVTAQDADFDLTEKMFCGCSQGYIPPDIDQNCYIDMFDYSVISSFWLESDCAAAGGCEGADISINNGVGIEDVVLLAQDWLLCNDYDNVICH